MTVNRLRVPLLYTGANRAEGPLLFVAGVENVGWDEMVEVRLPSGEARRGLVLEVQRDVAVVQVLQGTAGISPADVAVSFEGHPMEVAVGAGWLGRVWNGLGEPIDGGPPMLGETRRPVAGRALNPTARDVPREPVITGVSAIDALTTLVRGQKLPIFSSAGLPALELGEASVDERGALFGHPGGGALRQAPVRIAEQIVARGTDITRSHPTEREVFVLAAVTAPGDSGGPVVDSDGRVVGVMFAYDISRQTTAYALTRGELDAVLGPVLAGRAPHDPSTGECLSD